MSKILVIDNYDSFVYNIVQYLAQLGADVEVLRNDEVSAATALKYDGVLLSPGPGTPEDAGACISIIHGVADKIPVFGVCLGLQAIAVAGGAKVDRAAELLHGKTSDIYHEQQGVFANLPSPFKATRYHSLAVKKDTVPAELQITAWTENDLVMGMRHTKLDVEGVQFHPESVLTEHGHMMFANWLVRTGDLSAPERAKSLTAVAEN
ncbi:MAG: aminodeoxychorismate/anthranilate synthase component II [Actinomycetota bacterium]|nr:aminodeoxychorismate/anthranilate synthase component II [Actinomycetota bacterium]